MAELYSINSSVKANPLHCNKKCKPHHYVCSTQKTFRLDFLKHLVMKIPVVAVPKRTQIYIFYFNKTVDTIVSLISTTLFFNQMEHVYITNDFKHSDNIRMTGQLLNVVSSFYDDEITLLVQKNKCSVIEEVVTYIIQYYMQYYI